QQLTSGRTFEIPADPGADTESGVSKPRSRPRPRAAGRSGPSSSVRVPEKPGDGRAVDRVGRAARGCGLAGGLPLRVELQFSVVMLVNRALEVVPSSWIRPA